MSSANGGEFGFPSTINCGVPAKRFYGIIRNRQSGNPRGSEASCRLYKFIPYKISAGNRSAYVVDCLCVCILPTPT